MMEAGAAEKPSVKVRTVVHCSESNVSIDQNSHINGSMYNACNSFINVTDT